jgi:putative lipoic acid-binding regulatory protein
LRAGKRGQQQRQQQPANAPLARPPEVPICPAILLNDGNSSGRPQAGLFLPARFAAENGDIGYNAFFVLDIDMDPKDSLIEYPSDFPIKVMGLAHEEFAAAIADLVLGFDPTFHTGRMEQRPSAKGNYIGLTVIVRATSREQLDDLYRTLSAHPMVKVVL